MWSDHTEDGALIGYGPVQTQVYRQVARMLAKVLRGAKPAELPVEQPTISGSGYHVASIAVTPS